MLGCDAVLHSNRKLTRVVFYEANNSKDGNVMAKGWVAYSRWLRVVYRGLSTSGAANHLYTVLSLLL